MGVNISILQGGNFPGREELIREIRKALGPHQEEWYVTIAGPGVGSGPFCSLQVSAYKFERRAMLGPKDIAPDRVQPILRGWLRDYAVVRSLRRQAQQKR